MGQFSANHVRQIADAPAALSGGVGGDDPEPASGRATVGDGVTLSYALRGDESAVGRRYVLTHSLGLNRDVWASVAERLTGQAHLLVYDCRGHGASTKAPGPYDLKLFSSDLGALLDAVGWRSAIVAGVSMGGNIALEFTLAHPERVEALGLVDTTAWYGPDAAQQWETRARQAEEDGLGSFVDVQLGRWFSDPFRQQHPELMRRMTDIFLRNDVRCYAAACRMLGSFDLREPIGRIRAPTAIVVGDEDPATPVEMSEQLHAAIHGSSLEVLPSTRHLSPLERPDEIAAILNRLANQRSA